MLHETMTQLLSPDGADDGITVTELPDESDAGAAPPAGVFAAIFDAYRQHGYEAGYDRATRDAAELLIQGVADFIRANRDAAPEAHDALRRFEIFARRRLDEARRRRPCSGGFVEGGLGI
jgi:hypothetical protein